MARRLAQEGAKVVISSRREVNVKSAVDQLQKEGLDVSGVICHVGKAEDRKKLLDEVIIFIHSHVFIIKQKIYSSINYLSIFKKAVSRYGGLDILVPNAAANPTMGPVLDTSEAVWDKIFEINVKSTFLLMKESLPLLKQSKSPSITIMASIAGYQPFSVCIKFEYRLTRFNFLILFF